jgi:hypothetical protein
MTAEQEQAAKARVGWRPGPVYTVIGEAGNSREPYTRELPSMRAALDAIRRDDLPLAPVSDDGGLRQRGHTVSTTVRRTLCYEIIEHEPRTPADSVTGCVFGGIHHGIRRIYRLASGEAYSAGIARTPVPDADIPAAWVEYRDALAAIPPRANYADVYRSAL